jgi:hypothetical protein
MGAMQTSYRIIVADNPQDAAAEKGNVWDSGTIESRRSTAVIYGGEALQPSKNYFWRVKYSTNTGGGSEWSDVKAFRTAAVMSDYKAAFYPQVKSLEHPKSIQKTNSNTLLVDFGKDAFAQVLLRLTSTTGDDSVTVHLGETLKDGRIDPRPGGTIRYHRYAIGLVKGTNTYRVKIAKNMRNTGEQAVRMPDYIGEVLPFRYLEVEGYDKPLETDDALREAVFYPFDETASSFKCSNDTLNQIWEMCKYSVKATSFLGIYVDGDRERIPYEADAIINQLCHYGVDREYAIARRTHEYLLAYPTWPAEWILQAIMIAWYDYLYTGDSRSLRANYDVLKARSLMSLREKNGLVSTTTGLQTPEFKSSIRYFRENIRDIVDWPQTGILGLNKNEGGEADGFVFTNYNAVTNAYHYNVLKILADIALVLEDADDARHYRKEAADFLRRYNKTFFNSGKGIYVDGDTTTHSSLHSNMFPLAFGMTPSQSENPSTQISITSPKTHISQSLPSISPNPNKKILDFIRSRKMACSVYGSQFLMDALYEAADADYALQLLTNTDDRSWFNMLRVGSTISLEAWDNKYKPNQDWNHIWGAAPANIIPRKLIGVEPLTPAFDLVRIRPQKSSLHWVRSLIPTIKGAITLDMAGDSKHFVMNLTLPANMEGELYLPAPHPTTKFVASIDHEPVMVTQQKGSQFIYLGKISSGNHKILLLLHPL